MATKGLGGDDRDDDDGPDSDGSPPTPRPRHKGRGDRGRNDDDRGGRNRRDNRSEDFADSPDAGLRVLSNVLFSVASLVGGTLGGALGDNKKVQDFVDVVLPKNEAAKLLLEYGIAPGVAGAVQLPPRFRTFLMKTLGDNAGGIGNEMLDGALKAFIVNLGRSADKRRKEGRLTEAAANEAIVEATEATKRELEGNKPKTTFADVIADPKFGDARRAKLTIFMGTMTEEQRKKFDALRPQLTKTESVGTVLDMSNDIDAFFRNAELVFGTPKATAASAGAAVVQAVTGPLEALDAKARKFLAPPATGPDPVVDSIHGITSRLKRRAGQ